MQVPFPELRHLSLKAACDEVVPLIPGCEVSSWNASHFWNYQKFLLSATDPVDLGLQDVSDSGYISPELMVTCLSMLTRLES